MRHGVIQSFKISQHNRMDAGFHLTRQSIEDDGSMERAVAAVYAMIPDSVPAVDRDAVAKEKAYEIMMALPSDVRVRATKDLVRGSGFTGNIDRAIREYPFMAVAMAFRDEQADLLIQKQVDDLQSRLDRISGIGQKVRRRF